MFHVLFQDGEFLIIVAANFHEAATKAATYGDVASIIELEA